MGKILKEELRIVQAQRDDQNEQIRRLEAKVELLERTLELLVAAGHVSEEDVKRARSIAMEF